ncbi:MAG: TonB family protein [Hymenobacter sp.]
MLTSRFIGAAGAGHHPGPGPEARQTRYPTPDANQIYDAVEQPAVPKGGPAGYAQYLETHQKYPTAALQAKQEGTVKVSFVVEKNGYVSEVKVVEPVAPLLDAEARAGHQVVAALDARPPARRGRAPARDSPGQLRAGPRLGRDGGSARQPHGLHPAPTPGTEAAAPGTTSVVGTTANGTAIIRPEKSAQPVGGNVAFFAWVAANQKYPDLARKRHIQGKVPVEFTVQPDGSLTDVRVLRKHGSGLR